MFKLGTKPIETGCRARIQKIRTRAHCWTKNIWFLIQVLSYSHKTLLCGNQQLRITFISLRKIFLSFNESIIFSHINCQHYCSNFELILTASADLWVRNIWWNYFSNCNKYTVMPELLEIIQFKRKNIERFSLINALQIFSYCKKLKYS